MTYLGSSFHAAVIFDPEEWIAADRKLMGSTHFQKDSVVCWGRRRGLDLGRLSGRPVNAHFISSQYLGRNAHCQGDYA